MLSPVFLPHKVIHAMPVHRQWQIADMTAGQTVKAWTCLTLCIWADRQLMTAHAGPV